MTNKTLIEPFKEEEGRLFSGETQNKPFLSKPELKNRAIQIAFDVVVIICNFFIFAMVYTLVSPKIAYFTCDMSELSYPYKTNTIDEWVVGMQF